MITESTPYLYILMRSDLDSLNPGKAVAQGAHAANQFTYEMTSFINDAQHVSKDHYLPNTKMINLYNQWVTSTKQGFGVTITLDIGNDVTLHQVVAAAKSMGLAAGVTHDPSYPVADGQVTHLVPLDTCGYVFGDKDKLSILLGQFILLA